MLEKNWIVTSDGHFPKPYNTNYRYCLMVGTDNKVRMVWNYIAREFMDIRDLYGNNVNGQFTSKQIKNMYKSGEVGFYFYENPRNTNLEENNEFPF